MLLLPPYPSTRITYLLIYQVLVDQTPIGTNQATVDFIKSKYPNHTHDEVYAAVRSHLFDKEVLLHALPVPLSG